MSHKQTFMTDPSSVKIKKSKEQQQQQYVCVCVWVCVSERTVNQSKQDHVKNYPVMRESWEILTLSSYRELHLPRVSDHIGF